MVQRENEDKLSDDTDADIKLAIHEMALDKRRKKKRDKRKYLGTAYERLNLHKKIMTDEITMRELIYLSFLQGMITGEQYLDFVKTEQECAKYDVEESDGEDDWDSPLYPEGFPF